MCIKVNFAQRFEYKKNCHSKSNRNRKRKKLKETCTGKFKNHKHFALSEIFPVKNVPSKLFPILKSIFKLKFRSLSRLSNRVSGRNKDP